GIAGEYRPKKDEIHLPRPVVHVAAQLGGQTGGEQPVHHQAALRVRLAVVAPLIAGQLGKRAHVLDGEGALPGAGFADRHALAHGADATVRRSSRGGHMYQGDLLKGRVAVVTGGGSGLGATMATHFTTLGAQMAMLNRRRDKLKAVAG